LEEGIGFRPNATSLRNWEAFVGVIFPPQKWANSFYRGEGKDLTLTQAEFVLGIFTKNLSL